jgi:hypothetical protein
MKAPVLSYRTKWQTG